jgi:hypothetical protein
MVVQPILCGCLSFLVVLLSAAASLANGIIRRPTDLELKFRTLRFLQRFMNKRLRNNHPFRSCHDDNKRKLASATMKKRGLLFPCS